MDELSLEPVGSKADTPFLPHVPGSKSFTNRALILAAQRLGVTEIENALHAQDTELLCDCLNSFGGIEARKTDKGFRVNRTSEVITAPEKELYIGAAGTPARFLLSFAASAKGETVITGTKRLCERPMNDLLETFEKIGVRYECLGEDGCLPVRVYHSVPQTDHWLVSGNVSSQFTSSLLLFAAQQEEASLTVETTGELVSKSYVEMTRQIMLEAGIGITKIGEQKWRVIPSSPTQDKIWVETDASGATYFLGAAALTGTRVIISGVGKNSTQGDLGFARALERMGCAVSFGEDQVELQGAPLKGIEIDMEDMPDAVLTLAAVAPFAEGKTKITGIANLRIKECDRIHAAAHNLRKLGVKVIEGEASLEIEKAEILKPALIETFDDHRVAMAFSLVGLISPGITIEDPGCVAKSFPRFWEEYKRFQKHHNSVFTT